MRGSRAALFLLGPALAFQAGCVSSTDIESLQAQNSALQRQLAEMRAQGSSKEEVASLEATLRQQTDRLIKTEADMRVDLASLSSQIAQLQGSLEDTNYRISQLSQQIASANQDLRAVRSATAPPSAAPDVQVGSAVTAADPETLYQTSYSDYLRGAHDLALLGFRQYLEAYPETDLADNAVYWIGECFYRQQKYAEAIAEYDRVLERWPRSDKTASALLKKAYAMIELGQKRDGITQLQRVTATFPNSDEANLARQKLQSLGVAPGRQP